MLESASMRSGLAKNQWILVTGISLVVALLSGVGGLILGSWYGGNYRSSFEFNGVRGYEAFGQIGLAIGTVVGGATGCWIAIRLFLLRNARKRITTPREN